MRHILGETEEQRRVKVGTDTGRPVFSDEPVPSVADHGYDVLRYAIAARESAPRDKVETRAGDVLHV